MKFSYNKLWKLLIDKQMMKKDDGHVSPSSAEDIDNQYDYIITTFKDLKFAIIPTNNEFSIVTKVATADTTLE